MAHVCKAHLTIRGQVSLDKAYIDLPGLNIGRGPKTL